MDHMESSPTKLRNFATCLAKLPQVRRNLATLFGDNNSTQQIIERRALGKTNFIDRHEDCLQQRTESQLVESCGSAQTRAAKTLDTAAVGACYMEHSPLSREVQNGVSLFQPDVLAPLQYLEKWRYRRSEIPEIMLMFAVLDDAVMCYQKFACAKTAHGEKLFREAESWFFDGTTQGLYTCENICEMVGLDLDYLRKGLRQWRRNAGTQPPKFRLFYIVGPGRRARRIAKRTNGKSTQESLSD
jgi:hypothetical protein